MFHDNDFDRIMGGLSRSVGPGETNGEDPVDPATPGWFRARAARPRRAPTSVLWRLAARDGERIDDRVPAALDAGVRTVELDVSRLADGETGAEVVEQVRRRGIRPRVIRLLANPLAPGEKSRSSATELVHRFLSPAVVGTSPMHTSILVVSAGVRSNPQETTPSTYSPMERGRALRTLERWREAARRAGVELVVEPLPGDVLGRPSAYAHFAEGRAGGGAGLALAVERLSDAEKEDQRALVERMVGLVPWTRILYVGKDPDETSVRPVPTARSLARVLRVTGMPPILVLRHGLRGLSSALTALRRDFESMGVPLLEDSA